MTNTILDNLQDHWEGLREGKLPPFRSEISPRHLLETLDTLFILEMLAPDDIRVRIAGVKVCEMMGREVRGQTPLSFFDGNARGRFAAVMTDVLNRPTVARLGLETCDSLGNCATAEMILLPLRSDFGDVTRMIGCVTVPDGGYTAPLHYKINTVDLEGVAKPARRKKQPQGFAEAKADYTMEPIPNFQTIIGNPSVKPLRQTGERDYLKIVS